MLDTWKTVFITDTENHNVLFNQESSYTFTQIHDCSDCSERPVISFKENTYLIFTWNQNPFSTEAHGSCAHLPKWKVISQETG